jgi:hypothetical protein
MVYMKKNTILSFLMMTITFLYSCGINNQTTAITPNTHTIQAVTTQTSIIATIISQPTQTSTLPAKPPTQTATLTQIPAIPTNTPLPSAKLTEVPGVIVTDPKKECQKVPTPEFSIHTEPGILFSGTFYLCEQWPIGNTIPNDQALWGFDFDNAQVSGIYNTQNDLLYYIQWNKVYNVDVYNILSTNNSKLYITSNIIPTYDDCQKLVNSGVRADGVVEAEGAKACFLTNDGRIAYMRVEEINQYGWGSLTASFIVWENR